MRLLRNVIYVQGPYYDASSPQPFPNGQSAADYFHPVDNQGASVLILCFGHFNTKANYDNNGWGLVINNVAASDPSMPGCMAPIKGATSLGTTVLLSLGGAENPDDWTHITTDPALCAQQVADFLKAYGMQGIDIDNEDITDGAAAVGTFIEALAALVPGLIVSCSPMQTQMTFGGFFHDLAATPAASYIQWYNIQYYQTCTAISEDYFNRHVQLINEHWYGGKLTNPGNYVTMGAAPTQCPSQPVKTVMATADKIANDSTVGFGGIAWWNYPELSNPPTVMSY